MRNKDIDGHLQMKGMMRMAAVGLGLPPQFPMSPMSNMVIGFAAGSQGAPAITPGMLPPVGTVYPGGGAVLQIDPATGLPMWMPSGPEPTQQWEEQNWFDIRYDALLKDPNWGWRIRRERKRQSDALKTQGGNAGAMRTGLEFELPTGASVVPGGWGVTNMYGYRG